MTLHVGYIPLFAVTYFFWWVKPKDIETPTEIDLPAMNQAQKAVLDALAISNNFDSEGGAQQTSYWQIWLLTPRVFEKEAADADVERAAAEYQEQIKSHVERTKACSIVSCPACKSFDAVSPDPKDEIVLAH